MPTCTWNATITRKLLIDSKLNYTKLNPDLGTFTHVFFCYQDRKRIWSIQHLPHSYSSQSDGSTSARQRCQFLLSVTLGSLSVTLIAVFLRPASLSFLCPLPLPPTTTAVTWLSQPQLHFVLHSCIGEVSQQTISAYSTFNKRQTVHQYPAFKWYISIHYRLSSSSSVY